MRELKYNDFNGSISTSNRYFYSTNVSHYLSYNNIHHYQQQVYFKRFSSRIRPSNQCQRQFHRAHRQNQEINTDKVNK
jgi:hypothetical protein